MELLPITTAGVVLIIWELLREREGRPVAEIDPFSTVQVAPFTLCAAIVLLPILFGVQLQLLHQQSLHENGGNTAGFAALPIPVYIGRMYDPGIHAAYTAIAGVTAFAESLCLVAIVIGFAARPNTVTLTLAGIAITGVGLLAVFSPAMSTTDPYDYVRALDAGWKTYRPDSGVPTAGWIYGPLWFWLASAATSFASSAVEKIQAFRAINVLFLGGTIVALRFARVPASAVWAFILNPAIWFESVANPHLEIWGLSLVIGAYALSARLQRGGWLSALAFALAGAVKLPFLVLGAGAIASISPLRRRFAIFAAATLLAIVISWICIGGAYFSNVAGFARHRTGTVGGWNQAVRLAELFIALAAGARGFARGRNFGGMAWLAPQFAPLPFPWYSSWGVAFSLDRAHWLTAFLVTLPVLDVFMDYNYDLHAYGWLFPAACAIAGMWDLGRGRRQPAAL